MYQKSAFRNFWFIPIDRERGAQDCGYTIMPCAQSRKDRVGGERKGARTDRQPLLPR